jgi:hypothetical protein
MSDEIWYSVALAPYLANYLQATSRRRLTSAAYTNRLAAQYFLQYEILRNVLHLVTLQVVWVLCRLLQLHLTLLPPMMEKVPESQEAPRSQDEEEIHNETLLPTRSLNDRESDQWEELIANPSVYASVTKGQRDPIIFIFSRSDLQSCCR